MSCEPLNLAPCPAAGRAATVENSCEAGRSAVFVGQLDDGLHDRIESLLGSVGLSVICVKSSDELAECASGSTSACLLIDPTRCACGGRRWFRHRAVAGRHLPVVCVANWPSIGSAVDAMRSAAWMCLEESVTDQELLDEIQRAAREDARRVSAASGLNDWRRRFAVLSTREQEVLEMTVEGLTSKRIAKLLGISARTVDSHRAHVLRKLDVSRLSEAVVPYCLLQASSADSHRREVVT